MGGRTRRHYLRCQLPHHPDAMVGPGPTPRPVSLSKTIVAKTGPGATAETVGFMDRGLLAPGYKADINVIDFDALTLHAPTIVGDLPAGGNRPDAEGDPVSTTHS